MESGPALLSALECAKREERLQAIERLRFVAGGLRALDARRFGSALCSVLADESPDVRTRVGALLPEALEVLHKATGIQEELQRIAQRLAENLGDSREVVRAATRQGLFAYVGIGRNLPWVLKLVRDHGINRQTNWRVRLHNILSVQQFLTATTGRQLADGDVVNLVEVLAPCLDDSTELVAHATKQTLLHLESALDVSFLSDIRQTSVHVQKALEDHGIGLAVAPPDGAAAIGFAAGSSPCAGGSSPSAAAAAAANRPISPPATASSPEPGGASQNFHPQQVLEALERATKWQDRSRVLEDFHQTLLCIPVTESWPHRSEVLLILNRLLTDTNFKITLTTLYIIGDLMDRWSASMLTVVGAVVPGLMEKLGDNKIVIRQTAMKTFHKIFTAVVRMRATQYAEKLLQSLSGSLAHRSANARLELLTVIVMALLYFERGEVPYDRDQMVQVVCQAVQDPSEKVSVVAIEALAVLGAALGATILAERLAVLLQADRALLNRALARLEDSSVASVTAEGLVEYPTSILPMGHQLTEGAESPGPGFLSPSTQARLPNAAMAVGRLGRKMFCLESVGQDASPAGSGSASQSTQPSGSACSKRSWQSVGSQGSQARAQQVAGRPCSTLTSVSSSSTVDQPPSRSTSYTSSSEAMDASRALARMGRHLSSASSTSSGTAPDRFSPTPEPAIEEKQARSLPSKHICSIKEVSFSDISPQDVSPRDAEQVPGLLEIRSSRSPPTSSMKDRRRAPAQPLRVNFKEEPSASAHKDWGPSYAAAAEAIASPSFPSSSSEPVTKASRPTQCPATAHEELPNYIPNWSAGGNRPLTRQVTKRRSNSTPVTHVTELKGGDEPEDARDTTVPAAASVGRPPSDGAEDKDGGRLFRLSGRGFHGNDFSRPGCAGYLGLMDPDDPSPPTDISDKLKLLKRPAGGRARSQGSNRTSGSRLGQRPNGRSSRARMSAEERRDAARPSSPLNFGLEDAEVSEVLTPVGGPRHMVAGDLLDEDVSPCNLGQRALGVNALGGQLWRGAGEEFRAPISPSCARRMSAEDSLVPSLLQQPEIVTSISDKDMYRSQPRRPRAAEGQVSYLNGDELPPFDQPPSERWLEELFLRLAPSSDWITQCEALVDLRRVARHTPQVLGGSSGTLRQAVANVASLTESLRPSVAKGSLICLHDLFLAYRKQMDGDLERVASAVLKKAVDANGWSESRRGGLAMHALH